MILTVFVILFSIKVGKLNSDQEMSFNKDRTSMNFNSMKLHIKEVLNISTDHQTIEEFIENGFCLDNPDPTYKFVFHDENNRSLIYRRSDFKEMEFPEIPKLNKFQHKTSNMSKLFEMDSKMFTQTTSQQLIQNQFHDFIFNNLTSDDIHDTITFRNLQTERNFIKMMNDINDHPESFTKNPMNQNKRELKPIPVSLKRARDPARSRTFEGIVKPPDTEKSQKYKYTTNKFRQIEYNNDWDKLGLSGWSGEIREPKNNYEYVIEKPPSTETAISNIDTGKPENYVSKFNFQNSTKTSRNNKPRLDQFQPSKGDSPSTKQQKPNSIFSNEDKSVNLQDISEQLSIILIKERKELKQKNIKNGQKERVGVPKFAITSSRDQHLDEYVFIARTNNPFGHSTKWKLNSSSLKPISTLKLHEGRRKRGVVELYSMIKCGTGCDPLIYKGYGCYCGFLGSGSALDGIDRCCAMHDYCYTISSCPMFLEYFVPYLWKCHKGRPLCATDHGEWGGPESCAARLCECDRLLSKCLRQYYCPHKRAVCGSSPWRLFLNFVMGFRELNL